MRKIGIVGMGTIGRAIARAIDRGQVEARLEAVTGRDLDKLRAFVATLASPPAVLPLADVVAKCDLVVEAATQQVLPELAPLVLGQGKDLMVLSIGGLLGQADWVELARRNGCHIYAPSGAIVGLDGVKGACAGEIRSITMETRKPPKGLAGPGYFTEQGIDLFALTEETLVYEGPAVEACRLFPANVNVLAALSLAGLGPERTRLKLYAVPGSERNVHDITVEGEHGRFAVHIEGIPSETNPRTGRLSYLSAIAMLKGLTATLRVGT
jgi:aspartate dehydrogenase